MIHFQRLASGYADAVAAMLADEISERDIHIDLPLASGDAFCIGRLFDRAGRDGALPESQSLRPSFRPFGVVEVFGCGHGYAYDPAAANCPRSTFLNRASVPFVLISRRIDAYSVACGVWRLAAAAGPQSPV